MENDGAQSPPNCDLCEKDSVANWKCVECQQKLCDLCHDYHLKLAGTRHHNIGSLAESYSQGKGPNFALDEKKAGKSTAIAEGNKSSKMKEIKEQVAKKEEEFALFDDAVHDCEGFHKKYDEVLMKNKTEISDIFRKLKETIADKEKEILKSVEDKSKADKASIDQIIKSNKETKVHYLKKLIYIKRLLSTLEDVDDDSTVEQFAKDTLPKLAAMNVPSFPVSNLPKPFKLKPGKESLQSVIGTLVEDNMFDADQKALYRNQLKVEVKFKPEKGRSCIYSIQIRPDGKAWVTTFNYRVYLVLRSGHIHDEFIVKFLPTYTTVNRVGVLYCSSGVFALHTIKPDHTIMEFENLAPYRTFGLHTDSEDQLYVCLQKKDSPGKIAVFADNGMLLREICFDHAGQSMFSIPRYVAVTSKGQICVVDDEHLIVVNPSGKSCSRFKPDEDWKGKSIITDMNDNLLTSVCPLEFVPLPIHVTNVDGRVVKRFTLEGPGISGINSLAIDQQYEEPVLWIGTPNGHVIIAKFVDV